MGLTSIRTRISPDRVFLAYNILVLIAVFLGRGSVGAYVVLLLLHLSVLFLLGEKALYPFSARQKVAHKWAYYGSFMMAVYIVNYLQNHRAPDWYPTDHPAWIFVPFLCYGLLAVIRGYRVL